MNVMLYFVQGRQPETLDAFYGAVAGTNAHVGALYSYYYFRSDPSLRWQPGFTTHPSFGDSGAFSEANIDPLLFVKHPISELVDFYLRNQIQVVNEPDLLCDDIVLSRVLGASRAAEFHRHWPDSLQNRVIRTLHGHSTAEHLEHNDALERATDQRCSRIALGNARELTDEVIRETAQQLSWLGGIKHFHIYSRTNPSTVDLAIELSELFSVVSLDGSTWEYLASRSRKVLLYNPILGDLEAHSFHQGTQCRNPISTRAVQRINDCSYDCCRYRFFCDDSSPPQRLGSLGLRSIYDDRRTKYSSLFSRRAGIHNAVMQAVCLEEKFSRFLREQARRTTLSNQQPSAALGNHQEA